ncbi:MAG: threonine--tRNA ligase [Gammaproteobacteria bacterium]|nr:threonine--tRNA ligase [Gammaproteobacteria bacterium]
MPVITLPDGSKRAYEEPVSILDVALDIGPGLAKATIAGEVEGELYDACDVLNVDASLRIITNKDNEGIDVIRHSCAHLIGHAVKQLFPDANMVIGPVIDNGFYYDIAVKEPFTPEDLKNIEDRMRKLIKQNYEVIKKITPRKDVIEEFRKRGEEYKLKLIEDMPEEKTMGLYYHQDYLDMCRGPHVPNTRFLEHFKLTKVSGAYWRGDAKNEMLQRIYGTAWASKKDLNLHLQQLEEAEKRDHRKLGKQLNLFHFQEEAPGMAFWHPKGWKIYQVIRSYMERVQNDNNYKEIQTPQLVDYTLWEKSGHASKFSDEMFSVESDNRMYAIKPMNCPCHIQVFNQGLKSYRDLPLRLAEFGSCHRYEPSGSMHGLMRVRSFVQDDGHIFCTENQIQSEVAAFMELLFRVYKDFGFDEVILRLSTRPEKRVGSDDLWDDAEQALKKALDATGLPWELVPGEGAFYGPKIEYSLKDCMRRIQQCGTIQVDFFLPERLGAEYISEDNSRKTPVMLHRAILGSFERFIGVLIEHYGGAMPAWLAPEQVILLNITDKQSSYCRKLAETLKNKGFRANLDLRNEKIGFKIREHTIQKVPYLLVVGDKEVESGSVSVRKRGGEDLGTMTIGDFCDHLDRDIAQFGRSENALQQ